MAKLFQDSAKQCSEVFTKTMGLYQSSSIEQGQERLQDLMESSLSVLRNNVHSVVDANAQFMKSWDDLCGKK